MQGALDILRPLLAETGAKPIGTVVIGTVKGDVHDIGKNLVNIMLEGAGFTVYDLGVNVAPEKFVEQVQEHEPDIVGFSAFLTTTMPMFKANIKRAREDGPARPRDRDGGRRAGHPGVRRCGRRRWLRRRRVHRGAPGQGPDREPPIGRGAGMTHSVSDRLRSLAATASIEVTPRHVGAVAELDGVLPSRTSIYITALPGADPFDLVTAAETIRAAGHVPVPHITARAIAGDTALDALLRQLRERAAVDDVLVIAGGGATVAGDYHSSMDVLRSGLLERHGIVRAGVAGHPEGSPDIAPEAILAAIAEKNAFAASSSIELRIVSQFALAPEPYVTWERGLREAGNRLPVVAGIPGVTSPPALLKFALACGIGPSVEVLRKQSGGLLKLATTRLWRPDQLAEGIARSTIDDPGSLIGGLHLFPFGGVERSARWLAELRTAAAVSA